MLQPLLTEPRDKRNVLKIKISTMQGMQKFSLTTSTDSIHQTSSIINRTAHPLIPAAITTVTVTPIIATD